MDYLRFVCDLFTMNMFLFFVQPSTPFMCQSLGEKSWKRNKKYQEESFRQQKEVFAPCYRCCSVDFWPILTRDDSWTSIPRIWSDNGVGPTKIEVEKRSEQMVSVMSHFQLSLALEHIWCLDWPTKGQMITWIFRHFCLLIQGVGNRPSTSLTWP